MRCEDAGRDWLEGFRETFLESSGRNFDDFRKSQRFSLGDVELELMVEVFMIWMEQALCDR